MTRYFFWLLIGAVSLIGVTAAVIGLILLSLPDAKKIRGCITTEMFNVRLCPGDGQYTPLKQISPQMISAVIMSEDASFYHHNGFDFSEIKESLNKNLKNGGFVRGGSTITQQLVKNVFLTKDKNLIRKAREAFLTYEIEKLLTKSEILEKYLNVVQFGDGIFGVKAASKKYFSKDPSTLSFMESAFLVALLPNPVKYSVSYRNKKLSSYMRKRILTIGAKLKSVGRLSAEDYTYAKNHLDDFPWIGLQSSSAASADFIDSLDKTDFTSTNVSDESQENVIETHEEDTEALESSDNP